MKPEGAAAPRGGLSSWGWGQHPAQVCLALRCTQHGLGAGDTVGPTHVVPTLLALVSRIGKADTQREYSTIYLCCHGVLPKQAGRGALGGS